METIIKSIEFADYEADDETVTVVTENGVWDVQMTSCSYNSSAGCFLNFVDTSGEYYENSHPDDLDDEAGEVVYAAEKFASAHDRNTYDYVDAGFNAAYNNQSVEIRVDKNDGSAAIVIRDYQPGDYGRAITVKSEFDNLEDAEEYLEQFKTGTYQDVRGVYRCLDALNS